MEELNNTPTVVQVEQAEILSAINKAEVDMQISTAKQYPRDLRTVLAKMQTYATMDAETAESCFYVLKRGKNEDAKVIEGLSVRMAEIMAGAWGNLRVKTTIIGNDGKTITSQGVCHDLENNLAVSVEVKRRITDKYGKTFSEDMQVVTGNAASAIAFRNAVLKVIPKAVTKHIVDEVKKVALGKSIDIETSRQNIIAYFAKLGVTQQQILDYLDVSSINDIDTERIYELRGLKTAIAEGTTTAREAFATPATEVKEKKEVIKANGNTAPKLL